jgi:opacity protein-like surface antigen
MKQDAQLVIRAAVTRHPSIGRGKAATHSLARGAAVASLALAAALLPSTAPADEWSGSVTLYGWLPWMDVKASPNNGSGSTSTTVSASDFLDALKFAFFAAGEVHYGRVGLLQDFVYADLGNSGKLSGPFSSKVDVDIKKLLSTTALGYQVYVEDGYLVEPYAGARYVSIKTDVTIKGGGPLGLNKSADVDVDWWDPVIGVRGRVPLTEELSATGFANIGGFGVGSKFTWEVFGGLDYAFTERFSANAGFRYLSIDYDASDADVEMEVYGPVIGATLRF